MSLKAFHIIFIVASTMLSFGFAAWAITQYLHGDSSGGVLAMGIGAVVVGIGLVVYGRYVLRKLKNVSYL